MRLLQWNPMSCTPAILLFTNNKSLHAFHFFTSNFFMYIFLQYLMRNGKVQPIQLNSYPKGYILQHNLSICYASTHIQFLLVYIRSYELFRSCHDVVLPFFCLITETIVPYIRNLVQNSRSRGVHVAPDVFRCTISNQW
jgi:hypothetical protein